MATIAQMIVALGVDNSAFKRGLGQARDELGRFTAQVDRSSREAATFSKANAAVAKGLKIAGVAAVGFFGIGLAANIKRAASAATDFGLAMDEVSTLLSDTSSIPELTDRVKDLAIEFGKAPTDEARALYQIISAGATNAAEATAVLTAANRLAVGGVTDVATAADGLTTILNAYGPAAGNAGDVSDALFVAMRSGKTTIAQLAQSIGTVAPLAAQAGVSLEETLAATAALTKGGIATNVAMTGLRATIAAIIKPGQEASEIAGRLGIELSGAALKTQGLGGFLQDLTAKTGGNVDIIAKLVGGVEALAPVLALTGTGAKDFAQILDNMRTKAGESATALAKVAESPAQQFARLRASMAVLAIDLGNKLLKVIVPAVVTLNENFQSLVTLMVSAGKAAAIVGGVFVAIKAVGLASTITATVAAFIGLIPAINGMAGALTLASFAARGFIAALGPIGLAAAGIVALTVLFNKQAQAAKQAKEASDDYSASLVTLSRAQLEKTRADLVAQIEQAKTFRQASEQLASVAVSDATATRARATTSTARSSKSVRDLSTELTDLQGRLAAVDAQLAGTFDAQAVTDEINKILAGLGDMGDEATKSLTPFEALAQQITTVSERLQTFAEGGVAYFGWAEDFKLALIDAQAEFADLTRRINDQALSGNVDAALVRLAQDLKRAITDATRGSFEPIVEAAQEAIARVQALSGEGIAPVVQTQAVDALVASYRAITEEIERQGGPLRANLRLVETWKRLQEELAKQSFGFDALVDSPALDDLLKKLGDAAVKAAQAKLETADLGEAMTIVGDLAFGLQRVGDALGGIGEDAQKALDGVLQLADGIRQINGAKGEDGLLDLAKALPGIAGVVAGGFQLLGSLFGGAPSPEQIAMRNALTENSKRLQELRDGLDQFELTAGGTAEAGRTSARLLSDRDLIRALTEANNRTLFLPGDLSAPEILDARLRELGSSFTQFNAIAESMGLQLEVNGDISVEALQQIAEAAGLTAASLTRLSHSIDAQRRVEDLRAQLLGDTSEVSAFQREMQILRNAAPDIFDPLRGFDISSSEGREALRQGMLGILDRVELGLLTPDQLGLFENADALVDGIQSMADALDAIPEKITQFAETLDSQRQRMALAARLFDDESPAAAVRRELELLGQFAPQLADRFAGLDAATIEGRDAIRRALQDLFRNIEAGLLDEEALGQLEGLDDLLGIIGNVDSALDSFAEATNAATGALRGVPDGFKLALRAFESSFAEASFTPPPATSFTGGDLGIPMIETRPIGDTFEIGEITIVGAKDEDPEALADRFIATLRRRSLSQFGVTTRAAEVLR